MRAVPLVADDISEAAEGGALLVVHEDEDFVAVSKPPGVQTHPTHRWGAGKGRGAEAMFTSGARGARHKCDMFQALQRGSAACAAALSTVRDGPSLEGASADRTLYDPPPCNRARGRQQLDELVGHVPGRPQPARAAPPSAGRTLSDLLPYRDRFRGGSMVNRLITYLGGHNPHVLHRLDMDTSGLLLFAKHTSIVPGIHRQFRWVIIYH